MCLFSRILFFYSVLFFGINMSVPSSSYTANSTDIIERNISIQPYFRYYHFNRFYGIKVDKKWSHPSIVWFFPHNNEYSAQDNIDWAYKNFGGYSIQLVNIGNSFSRNLRFYRKKVGFIRIDPNRMTTPRGLTANLKEYNRHLRTTYKLRKSFNYIWYHVSKPSLKIIKKYWSQKRPMVALHNNRYISTHSFDNNPCYKVALFDGYKPTSFVLVIKRRHFNTLKKYKINTVYQRCLAHDGSFSDYAIFKNWPYINIETYVNNGDVQKKLISTVPYLLFHNQFHIPKNKLQPIYK